MIPVNLGKGKGRETLSLLVKCTQTSALFDLPE